MSLFLVKKQRELPTTHPAEKIISCNITGNAKKIIIDEEALPISINTCTKTNIEEQNIIVIAFCFILFKSNNAEIINMSINANKATMLNTSKKTLSAGI